MGVIDAEAYGAGAFPYRYYAYSPVSGSYADNATITISATLKLYDSDWSGSFQGIPYAGIIYYDASGNGIATDDVTSIVRASFSGMSGTITIPLASCPNAANPEAASMDVFIDTTVYTEVGVNTATVTTAFANRQYRTPGYTITHVSVCGEPTAPTLEATLSREPVRLTWGAGSGGTGNSVTGYDVERCLSADGSSWGSWEGVPGSPVTGTEMRVSPPDTAGSYYKYRVRTRGSAGSDYYSGWVTGEAGKTTLRCDHEPLAGFTDDPLTAGASPVKALHMQELQSRVSTLRTFYGLGAYSFTTITAGVTSLAGWTTHVNQVRAAIEDVCSASGKTHENWISFSTNCPRADVIQQLRSVILAL